MKLFSLALVGLLFPLTGQAKGPGLLLLGPESVTSDRDEPVTFALSITPKPAQQAQDIQIRASAGVVLGIQATSDGVYQFKFRPPWVVTGMQVHIAASLRLGKRTLSTSKSIRVEPAEIRIEQVQSSGPLEIRAPSRIVFDRPESASISLKKPEGDLPRMLVSTGKLSDLKEVPGGRLQATYTPPEKQFPQVAIIAAHRGGILLDWTAIPLHAQARVDTRTEPGASVDILIGDTIFGPLMADRKGRANMDVLVGPGIPRGTAIATDQLGNTKKAGLDLRVPAFRRILGLCPIDTDRLRVLVVDARGNPLPAARLEVKTSKGTLSSPAMTAPGVYESIHSLPEGVPIGETIELSASLRGDKASAVTCSTRVKGLPPASMKLVASPSKHVAGGAPVTVSIDLTDRHGQPARMVSVELTTSLGKVGDVRTMGPGRYSATWTLPPQLKGLTQAGIQARTRGQPVVASESFVTLEANRISRIELTARQSTLVADGRSSTTIQARAFDEFGNLVAPVKLTAVALGKIDKLTDPEKIGTYRATYTTPEMIDPQADTIVVTEVNSKIESSLRIDLQESRPALSVGPRIGYSTNLGRIKSAYFGVDTGIHLPFFQDLWVGVEFGTYWSDTRSQDAGGTEEVSTSVWVVPILARAVYNLPLQPVAPYLGIGLGTAIVGREVSSPSAGKAGSSRAHFAISGILGADLALGPGRVFAELAYLYIVSEETVVQGNTGGLLATVGYRFGF